MTDTPTPAEVTDADRMDRPNQEVVREPDGDPTNVGEPDDGEDPDTDPAPEVDPDPDPVEVDTEPDDGE